MITVSEEIEKIVLGSHLLEEGLSQGIINLSALSRKIKPQIDSALMKNVSESAILMALKRFTLRVKSKEKEPLNVLKNKADITVRSNLSEFTFLKSDSILERKKKLLEEVKEIKESFITFTQGVFETTIIISADLTKTVENIFKKEKTLSTINNLSAITIKLSPEIIYTPGVYYSILKQLAWKNINVVEVVSTYTEFTIILKKEYIDLSFSILLNFLSK
jgi:hypothetical protein